ncbi:hypothetical protein O6H91_18G080800 [Diphasiastrum complanatum]|uniref:Uncharacterized protein n=1 Tax=Diphasiastrum complanatum TaxID=34168 RepID=A0ACC2B372_DIPCM|nr:hypothetical protein O6H91_18G080800 [Diphasiastrum complanatum]
MQSLQKGDSSGTDDLEDNAENFTAWEDFYRIDWTPKEFLIKFRQQLEGYQLGANFEVNGCNTKLVFKPIGKNGKWRLMFEPKKRDLRLLSRKISLGSLLNFQVGIGHDFHNGATGWKWKITSAFGEMGNSHIRHKTSIPVFPGFDVRVGWNAEYVLPDIHGSLGTGEPVIGMNLGHVSASIERVEAIFTHVT